LESTAVINPLFSDFVLINIIFFWINTGEGIEMNVGGRSQEGSDWGHSDEWKGGHGQQLYP
jgi:hypothetical protein